MKGATGMDFSHVDVVVKAVRVSRLVMTCWPPRPTLIDHPAHLLKVAIQPVDTASDYV